MLYDGGTGVDFYDAEVMSFGSSYWYAIGMLYDEGGNDRYSLAHYGIGAGIHLSLGAFYDKAGDDQYRSRMGVVGGTGHDLSVGMFVDGDGDDSYGICDGWGVSLTNSVGLFIDRQGNDTYGTRNAGFSFGDVRWDRGFAGCGIFLDLEGDDVYPTGEPAADSTTWIQMGWGIGMDLARDVVTEKEEPVSDPVLTAEDSARSVEDLWREASQWNVGNARESVAKARKALNTKGMDAIRYAVAERLGTRDGLEMDVIQEVINLFPDSSGPLLIAKLDTTDRYTRGNAAYFLGMMKFKPAVDPLLRLLKKDDAIKVRNSVIGALGQIGEARAAPPIGEFVTDPDQRRRISALNALRGLKNPETIPAVIRGLEDPIFTVRSDAATSLMEFGVAAVPAVNDYVSDKRSAYPELGVKALGRIAASLKDSSGSEYARIRYDADRLFTVLLSDLREQVRAAAVESLYRIGGDATRQLVQSYMEAEYSPVVKAAFKRVKEEK
jgi:HEAT repeat protein